MIAGFSHPAEYSIDCDGCAIGQPIGAGGVGQARLEAVDMRGEEELLQHLRLVTGLDPVVLEKIVGEIEAWFDEDLAAWVRRRHRELHRQGLRNREIYPRLKEDARGIRVRPGPLSERQIRRIVYG
jgi:hypothetical protein